MVANIGESLSCDLLLLFDLLDVDNLLWGLSHAILARRVLACTWLSMGMGLGAA